MSEFFAHESSYIDSGAKIGENTNIWHFSHIQDKSVIGKNCIIGQNVFIADNVIVGNNVKIQNNVSVYEGVTLENYVFCGPSVVFTNDLSPRAKYPKNNKNYMKTIVREGASLGANCTIICGNTIGKNALVAAGALVTKNVKNHQFVIGCPAKPKGWICECGRILNENLHCNFCDKQYIKNEEGLEEELSVTMHQ